MDDRDNGLMSFVSCAKGRRILYFTLAAILVFAVGLFILGRRQPAYQGLTLGQWIVLHRRLPDRQDAAWDEESAKRITKALRKMKPEAIPVLLKWTSYEQPAWRKFLYRYMPFVLRFSLGRKLCEDRRDAMAELGLDGFRILGPEAAEAVPRLVKRCGPESWARNPPAASRAWTAIQTTGEPGTIVLANIAKDPRNADRITALDLLAHAGAWTTLDQAFPLFVSCLKDKNVQIAVRTAQVFRTWGHQLPNAIPALEEALGDPRPQVRQAAVEALGQALPSHRRDFPSAIPALRAICNDPDPEVRSAATNALRQVLPPGEGR